MQDLLPELLNKLPEQDVSFVFPSQVAADFWRRRVLESGELEAVRWDRFQSWDSFKEDLFSLNRQELPVNSRIRKIYVSGFLKDFAEGRKELQTLINPEFRKTARVFQGYMAGLLPHLYGFLKLIESGKGNLEHQFLSDLEYIYRDYGDFMEAHGLFEPGWVKPEMSS